VYDPFLTPEEADELGVERASLDEVFSRSDVVSLHAPCFPETVGMVTGRHLGRMRTGATFINTARGALVRQQEMIDVASRRADLQFVLDVADPEPLPRESPLYELDNVVLTPHIAGSAGNECRRMGRTMVEELDRFIAGQPLHYALTAESVRYSSHRPVLAAQS
jgi:phosphoglycerate dehydrogenase-like enzyme